MHHNPCFIRINFAIDTGKVIGARDVTITILVLLELTLQYEYRGNSRNDRRNHNPCFIRINFAIRLVQWSHSGRIISQSLFY